MKYRGSKLSRTRMGADRSVSLQLSEGQRGVREASFEPFQYDKSL